MTDTIESVSPVFTKALQDAIENRPRKGARPITHAVRTLKCPSCQTKTRMLAAHYFDGIEWTCQQGHTFVTDLNETPCSSMRSSGF